MLAKNFSAGVLLALILSGCVTTNYHYEDHALVGQYYHPGTGRIVDAATFHQLMQGADFVLLGEVHDNPQHHLLQAEAVTALFGQVEGDKVVVFEHVHSSQAPALKAFQSLPQKNPLLLADLLSWEKSGWPPFEIFEPVFAAAIATGARILPGNFPPQVIKEVYRDGMPVVLPEQTIARYRLQELPETASANLSQLIVDSHCGVIQPAQAGPMTKIQQTRDAFMALQLATARGAGKAVLMAGKGHTRKDFGVPQYLAKLQPTSTVLSVGMIEVSEDQVDPKQYSEIQLYDLVYFTAAWQREDQCEKMRAMMKRHKKRASLLLFYRPLY